MTEEDFRDLIGKDIYVEYPFGWEIQIWSMKNFYIDEQGNIHHNRLPLIIDNFIKGARNPHYDDVATHG